MIHRQQVEHRLLLMRPRLYATLLDHPVEESLIDLIGIQRSVVLPSGGNQSHQCRPFVICLCHVRSSRLRIHIPLQC